MNIPTIIYVFHLNFQFINRHQLIKPFPLDFGE